MDKLTPDNQAKLHNILHYYTNYRKNHYDDNIGIAIENQQREEKQKEINKELEKVKVVRTTEEYIWLNDEKYKIYEQIETSYDGEINETIESLCKYMKFIENKQLQLIRTAGVNIEWLEDNNITNLVTRLL